MTTLKRILILLFLAVIVAAGAILLVDNGILSAEIGPGDRSGEFEQGRPEPTTEDGFFSGDGESFERGERPGHDESSFGIASLSVIGKNLLIIASICLGIWLLGRATTFIKRRRKFAAT